MCWKYYTHTVVYDCQCKLSNINQPRVISNFSLDEVNLLLEPSQKIGIHYFKNIFGVSSNYQTLYCNTCLMYFANKKKYCE